VRVTIVDAPSPPSRHDAALDAARLAALLRLQLRAAEPEHPAASTPIDFRLRGTLSPALACVEPLAGGRARSVVPGDALGDATVEEVGHGFLTLRRPSGLSRLAIAVAPTLSAPTPSASTQVLEVPRSELERARTSLQHIAAQMRILPAFEAGRAVGFKIAWLAPDAVALKAGLRAGDVVTAVNGHTLTNIDAVLALAKDAQTLTHFTADILRAGAPLRLEVKSL
jgi:hypothetical protein